MNWKATKFGDILKRVERFEERNPSTTYQFSGTYSFGKGIFLSQKKKGNEFALEYIQRIKYEDFIYCKIMAWEGGFGVAQKESDNTVMSGAFVAYEIDKEKILPEYLNYYFKLERVWKSIGGKSTGTNLRRRSLHPDNFEANSLPLPSLPIQKAIIKKLEAVKSKCDKAIQLRLLAEKEVEALKQSLYNEKFIELSDAYENIEVGNILTLSSGNGITREFINKHSGEYAVYGGGGFIGRISKYFIEQETIAIGRVGARCGCIFKTEPKSWVSDNALYITELKREMDLEYLIFVLSLLDLRKKASQTAQPVISQSKVYPQLIPIPSTVEEQKEILREINSLTDKIHQIKTHQQLTSLELKALFPSVLEKAFKGEL